MKIDLLDNPSRDVHIEIVPLIDVIFCILTFFILAAVGLTRQQAINLDLPTAQTGQSLPGQVGQGADRLYVSIDGFGQVYLDQQPVPIELLRDVLGQFNQVNPGGLIVLYAARDARYEDVVVVLDELRAVGGDRVALATLPADTTLGPEDATPSGDPAQIPEGFPQEAPEGQLPPAFGQPDSQPQAPTSPLFPSEPTSPLQEPASPFQEPASPLQPAPKPSPARP